jgi:DNA end-binding protein Ku
VFVDAGGAVGAGAGADGKFAAFEVAEAAQPAGQVVDLMAALNASVAKARESRGEDEHATVHEMPKPKKKTAKKAPAKKSTARKTAAKKSLAKKSAARRNPRVS